MLPFLICLCLALGAFGNDDDSLTSQNTLVEAPFPIPISRSQNAWENLPSNRILDQTIQNTAANTFANRILDSTIKRTLPNLYSNSPSGPTIKKTAANTNANSVLDPTIKRSATNPSAKGISGPKTQKTAAKPTAKSVSGPTTQKTVAKPTAKSISGPTTQKTAAKPPAKSISGPTTQKTVAKPTAKSVSGPTTQKTAANPSAKSPVSGPIAANAIAKNASGPTTQKPIGRAYSIKPGGNRIVGGVKADITPFIGSLEINEMHACGSAIISRDWILTAAHCCGYSVVLMRVRVGSSVRMSGGTLYYIAQKIVHQEYNKETTACDIALLRPKKPIVFTYYVQPIKLCSADMDVTVGALCTAIGWGRTSEGGKASNNLLMAYLEIIDLDYCRDVYSQSLITDKNFCAGDTTNWSIDTCQGDSGGPIVYMGCLGGIVSWGIGCAREGNPGVYTKVMSYISWIAANTGIMSALSQRTRSKLLQYNSTLIMRPVQISIN